jgi:hypothetical protein
LVFLAGCGGSSASAPEVTAGAAVSDDAPGWARRGDAATAEGNRFICEGQGDTEDGALAAARAICDDKICKLCGVEVESIVQTSETLTGVEMERKVVERCRRVRQGDTEAQRKSVDCGPVGCLAWIQIDYSNERRDRECKRLTDENFADPEACQALIEEFKNVEGHSAGSFRKRVSLLEEALTACAEIDVRPTPLMESLREKLAVGMTTFRRGAPRYLRNYWLADFGPMWVAYKESPKFAERLQLLLGYLRHKVPILDVLEATYDDDEKLDTPQGLSRLFAAMKAAPKEEAYGVEFVHMVAASHLGDLAERGHMTQDLSAVNAWMRATYPGSLVTSWDYVPTMYTLFGADGVIDADEWAWTASMTRWRSRARQEMLQVERHTGGDRVARLLESLRDVREKNPKLTPIRALDAALPSRAPALLLAAESKLPKDVRDAIDWDFLSDQKPYWDAWKPLAPRQKYMQRMRRALATAAVDRPLCFDLYKRLELLDDHGVPTTGLDRLICGCLEGPMKETPTLNSGNKSPLYERAMKEKMACVQPRRSSS